MIDRFEPDKLGSHMAVKNRAEQGSPRERPSPPLSKSSFEVHLRALPPDVRSVAESLALRDRESAERYVAQYLSAKWDR